MTDFVTDTGSPELRSTQTGQCQNTSSSSSRGICQPLEQASRCLAKRRGDQREGGVQPGSGWRAFPGPVDWHLSSEGAPRMRCSLEAVATKAVQAARVAGCGSGPALPRRRWRTPCRASRLSLRRSARRRPAAALAWRTPAYAGS